MRLMSKSKPVFWVMVEGGSFKRKEICI